MSDKHIINVGSLIRRKSDEIEYTPSIGLIYDDGSVRRKRLDTSGDLFHEHPEDRKELPVNMAEFIEGLEKLGEHGLNFREAVENHLRNEDVSKEVAEIIRRAMEPMT